MANLIRRRRTLEEIAAEKAFERHNEIRCIQCGETFIVEELSSKHGWKCPNCEKQNPNLYFHFLLIGVVLAVGLISSLTMLILYMKAFVQNVSIFCIMWSAAHMLLIGYILITIYGDKHSYGLIPLRYLIPIIYFSSVASAIVYQLEYSTINIIVGTIVFGGIGAFIGYSFYLSHQMAEGHAAAESIIRPIYSMISIAINVVLLLVFTTIALKTTRRTPGTSNVDFGTEGGYVAANLEAQDLTEEIEQIEDELELDKFEMIPEMTDLERPEIKEILDYDSASSIKYIKKKEEDTAKEKITKKIQRNPKYEARYERQLARERGGGSDETEAAVLSALRWLKKHQNHDGSWGEGPYQSAMTGLALLCFLGHGEDHLSREFGHTVRSAINWFVEQQDDKGYFADAKRAYQHGIATYAMAEAYGMTDLDDLKPVVSKAIQRIIDGQTPIGGWAYGYAKPSDPSKESTNDTSVSGWQIQALKAAHSAGIAYSDQRLLRALGLAVNNLKRVYSSSNNTFGYTGPGGSWADNLAMTATGTLCMQFLGQFNLPEVTGALGQMRENYKFDWKEVKGGRSGLPLYSYYYATQAFFQATSDPSTNPLWRYWNPQMQKALLPTQNRDGSWDNPPKSRAKGVLGHPDNTDVWATSLCCLMLEVYYRYLPTYRIIQK